MDKTIGKQIAETWYEGNPDDGDNWARIQGLSRMIDTMTGKELQQVKAERDALAAVLRLVLDHVDYSAGNCRLNEMVGAVLPLPMILKARAALAPVVQGAS